MKILILSLVLLLTSSCNNNDENNSLVPQTITPILVGKGNLMGSESIPTQNITINDNVSWNNIINSIDQYRLQQLFTSTNVNFNDFQLLAVFDNVYGNEGHSINITDITENSSNIVVIVQTSYTPTLISIMTQPFHIVKIPKSTKPVVFQ